MRRSALILGVTLTAVVAGQAPAQTPVDARLQGGFNMKGTVTFAQDVYGEQKGQQVLRRWTFKSTCAAGPCQQVTLVRQRGSRRALDRLVLTRSAPGVYSGSGGFVLPLICKGRVVKIGAFATETITVTITRMRSVNGTAFASRLSATYSNTSRKNLTHCPGKLGRDAVSYTGKLIKLP